MSAAGEGKSGLSDEGVALSATVIVGSALAGLAFGFALDIMAHVNGTQPTTSQKILKTAKYALQGFALGSIVAGTIITISKGNEP